MDNLEYLNHIAQSNRPTKRAAGGASTSLIVKILLGGVALFAIILIFGGMLGGKSSSSSDLLKQLYLRTTNLDSTLTTYNRSLKSSKLRAIGVSLSGTLGSASSQLSTYITSTNSGKNPLEPPAEIAESEAENFNDLNLALENAKLNGVLDRTYTTQVHLQVSLLLTLISQVASRDPDAELYTILDSYSSNLIVIEQSFQEYSNPSA